MGDLLVLSGIDCSGKSTQIERLARALAAAGRRPRVLWLRPGYSRTLDAIRRLVRAIRPGALPTVADPAARARAFQRGGVKSAWVALALLDAILHYALWIRWARLLGYTVICDRYVEDALLDLRLRFPALKTDRRLLARCLRALAPRPTAAMLLTISHEEMLRRMARKQEPFPDPPDVRERRYAEYLGFRERGYAVVDGGQSVDAVHAAVRRIVGVEGVGP